jgi:hypothetical protein
MRYRYGDENRTLNTSYFPIPLRVTARPEAALKWNFLVRNSFLVEPEWIADRIYRDVP